MAALRLAARVFRTDDLRKLANISSNFGVKSRRIVCDNDSVRHYSRNWVSRKPIRIIQPGEADEDDEYDEEASAASQRSRQKAPKVDFRKGRNVDRRKGPIVPDAEESFAADEVEESSAASGIAIPRYIKLGDNNTLFTAAMNLAKSRNQREKKHKVLLEGRRLIKDALDAGAEMDSLFFSRDENLAGLDLEKVENLRIYKVMYRHMQIWSDLTTCPGIMGVFYRPDYGKFNLKHGRPLTVICDNIREPGNLGAVLRCAAAAGCGQIYLTKGCVDVWEQKVLRGACGAHFRVRLENNMAWEFMSNFVSENAQIFLADSGPNLVDLSSSADESLPNFERQDARVRERTWYEVTEEGAVMDHRYTSENTEGLEQIQFPPGSVMPYHTVRLDKGRPVVLVIGGETEGLSGSALQFGFDRDAKRINIPLENDIESLNSAVALGILVFHMRQQLDAP